MKRALLVALAVCLLGGLAAGVQRVLQLRAATQPPSPEAYVQATWSVYRFAPGHRVHVGEQDLACTACHDSAEGGRFDEPGPGKCRACHEAQTKIDHVRTHVDPRGQRVDAGADTVVTSDCLLCHGFGPDADQKPTDCLRCHAQSKNQVPAVVVHAKEACTTCHDVHENRVQPIDCRTCHALDVAHGKHPAGAAAQCLDCHTAHGEAETAQARCAACHVGGEAKQVPVSAEAHGHTCTGCHAPHGFTKRQVQPCTSCHADQRTLEGKGHRACTACHEPHAVGASVAAKNVCTGCHQKIALEHPTPVDPSTTCTSCHAPHPKRPNAGPAACASCHADVAASDLAAHAPGVACTGCHAPHAFTRAKEGLSSCTACHKPRIAQLSKHSGHARCAGCHTSLPHGGIQPPASCGSCHATQQRAVHAGHQQCTTCHDAHTGARPPQLCSSCHAEQTAKLSPKHQPCQRCHEPHAATPSAEIARCTGCHAPAKLPGLHGVTEHRARCESCHQAHPEQRPGERAVCLTCHQDQVTHQPEATSCNGCHAFRAAPRRGAR